MLVAAVALCAGPAWAKSRIPLPKPRPAEAPAAVEEPDTDTPDAAAAKPEPAKPPPPSACRLALTDAIATAPSIPDITAPGGCGGTDLVRLEAIMMPDGGRVAVSPAAILRCPMARALTDWLRTDIAPLTASLGARLAVLDNFDSYECRGRNRVKGAQLSEHGRANAIDVRALKLVGGQSVSLTDRAVPRALRENVLRSVCARFTTVLGPGSDGYHEDHIHLDIAERRSGYRICHWEVWEGLPQIAPLLPAERPTEAPPRQTADRDDSPSHGDATPTQAAPSDATDEPAPSPPPAKPKAKKKPHPTQRL